MACNCDCYFISIECVAEVTPLNWNMDNLEIEKSFCLVHSDYIKPILNDCYVEMCAQYKAADNDGSNTSINEKYRVLSGKMFFKNLIAWQTYYVWLDVFGRTKRTAKGLKTLPDISQEEIYKQELSLAQKHISKNKSELLEYIKDEGWICTESKECAGRKSNDLDLGISVI